MTLSRQITRSAIRLGHVDQPPLARKALTHDQTSVTMTRVECRECAFVLVYSSPVLSAPLHVREKVRMMYGLGEEFHLEERALS